MLYELLGIANSGMPKMAAMYIVIYSILIKGLSIFLHIHIKSGFDFGAPAK